MVVLWNNKNTLDDVSHSALLPDDWVLGTQREDGVHCYRFAGMIVHLRGADGGICSICVCVCVYVLMVCFNILL